MKLSAEVERLMQTIKSKLDRQDYEVQRDFSDLNNAALGVSIVAFQDLHRLQTTKWKMAQFGQLEHPDGELDDDNQVITLQEELERFGTGDDFDALADHIFNQMGFIHNQMGILTYEKSRRDLQGGEDSKPVGNCEKIGLGYTES